MAFRYGSFLSRRPLSPTYHLNAQIGAVGTGSAGGNTITLITRPPGAGSLLYLHLEVISTNFRLRPGDYRPKTFTTLSDVNETLTCTAHGYLAGDGPIRASNSGGALPTGLSATVDYFIGVVDANTIALYTSEATAITNLLADRVPFTGAGTGTHTLGGMTAVPDPTSMHNYIVLERGTAAGMSHHEPFVMVAPQRLTVLGSAVTAVLKYWFAPASE